MDIAILDDDVAQIDANPKYNPLFFGYAGIALCHAALHRHRTGDGLYNACEFDQYAVAGRLNDPALVLADFWLDEFAAMGSKPRESAGFVLAHHAAVAGDIGGENGRKPALYPLPAQDTLRCSAQRSIE